MYFTVYTCRISHIRFNAEKCCSIVLVLKKKLLDFFLPFIPLIAQETQYLCKELPPAVYSYLSNKRGEWNKRGGWRDFIIKVENILKACLGSIPSTLPSVKIQIMGEKVWLT